MCMYVVLGMVLCLGEGTVVAVFGLDAGHRVRGLFVWRLDILGIRESAALDGEKESGFEG